MKCPTCEEGVVTKNKIKHTSEIVYICDTCETVWKEGETISSNTGHPITQDETEYGVEENEGEDQEHRDIYYSKVK